MPDGFIQLPADSSGKKIDTSDLVVGGSTSVHRERYVAADPTSATGLATVTSSGGLQVAVTNPSTSVTVTNLVRSLSSGTVTLSSNPTVVLSSNPAITSGTVTLSSNHTFVSASSGLVQISGGTFLTSGTVTLSSNPTVVSASSGLVQISGTPTVTATAATNPWSSAPGFNVPMVSASSGLVQISGTATIVSASSGLVQAIVTGSSGVSAVVSSGNSLQVTTTQTAVTVTAANALFVALSTVAGAGPLVLTASSGYLTRSLSSDTIVSLVTSSQAYAVSASYGVKTQTVASGSSAILIVATTVSKISSAPGILWGLHALTTSAAATGAYLRLYDLTTGNATSSGSMGLAGACSLLRIASSVASMPYEEAYYWPQGIKFGTACSFDLIVGATSTAGATVAGWVTAQYTS